MENAAVVTVMWPVRHKGGQGLRPFGKASWCPPSLARRPTSAVALLADRARSPCHADVGSFCQMKAVSSRPRWILQRLLPDLTFPRLEPHAVCDCRTRGLGCPSTCRGRCDEGRQPLPRVGRTRWAQMSEFSTHVSAPLPASILPAPRAKTSTRMELVDDERSW